MLVPGFLAVRIENEPVCGFLCYSEILAVFTVSLDLGNKR